MGAAYQLEARALGAIADGRPVCASRSTLTVGTPGQAGIATHKAEFCPDGAASPAQELRDVALHRLKDTFFGQWLVANVPHRRGADLVEDVVVACVPERLRYFAMCMHLQPTLWGDDFAALAWEPGPCL